MSDFYQKIVEIQTTLNAPKSQYNKFGKYPYRNCEDILEALKPLLKKHGLAQFISDEIVEVAGRIYVKATVRVTDGANTEKNTAYAREEENKKGMDAAQLTGATSSYARKYALNGMWDIDDNKDPDSNENHQQRNNQSGQQNQPALINEKQALDLQAMFESKGYTLQTMLSHWKLNSLSEIQSQNYQSFVENVKSWGNANG